MLVDVGQPQALRGALSRSYRCPPEVMGLGNAVLAGEKVSGGAVFSGFADSEERMAVLAGELDGLPEWCRVAVMTRTDAAARRMSHALRRRKLAVQAQRLD